jgi:hypothetical protein
MIHLHSTSEGRTKRKEPEMAHIDTHSKTSGERYAEWYAVGSQIAQLANEIAGRSDLVGLASPVAGTNAPACYKPAIAEIEVNTEIAFGFGIKPEHIGDINQRSTQYEFPKATGAVMHEAFHARFSKWSLESAYEALKSDEYEALMLLEESRIEAQGILLDARYRAFLCSSAMEIVIADFESADLTQGSVSNIATLVGLVHGRIIGGILERDDVLEVTNFVEEYLGNETVEKLCSVIERFITHTDHRNMEPVYPLAREWAQIIRDLANERGEDTSGGGSGESSPKIGEALKELLDKLKEASENVAVSNYSELANQEESEEWKEEVKNRADSAKQNRENVKVAQEVFGQGTGPSASTRTRSYATEVRKPTADERISAVKVASALERAKYRERDVVEVRSIVPGGRLRTRLAIQNEAQKAMGVQPTAQPWRKRVRKTTDEPTLKVGVMVDISGSMNSAMQPMATTAWVMSEATRRVQGKCAMVYYGDDVFPTLKAGQHLTDVTVYTAPDGTEKFDKAFKAIDGELNLLNGDGARLLVVVSDGVYTYDESQKARSWVSQCESNGVAVVWIPFDNGSNARSLLKGTTVEPLSGVASPTEASNAIGQACAKALTAMGNRNG